MEKVINYAVRLLEQTGDPNLMPSQNAELNPSQNAELNPSQNQEINESQNPEINPSQGQNWKQNQWDLFKETILWARLDEDQREACFEYLKSL